MGPALGLLYAGFFVPVPGLSHSIPDGAIPIIVNYGLMTYIAAGCCMLGGPYGRG